MRTRGVLAAVVAIAGVVVPAGRAEAARGFAWTQAPVDVGLVVKVVQAKWHANYADPRCPMREDLDEHPDAHTCGGAIARIGVWISYPFKAFVERGMDSATVPTDDYSDDVIGSCIDSPSEGALFGPGPDDWQAVWIQNISHHPDHHSIDPHRAPVLTERDFRWSGISNPPRCDYTQVT